MTSQTRTIFVSPAPTEDDGDDVIEINAQLQGEKP